MSNLSGAWKIQIRFLRGKVNLGEYGAGEWEAKRVG